MALFQEINRDFRNEDQNGTLTKYKCWFVIEEGNSFKGYKFNNWKIDTSRQTAALQRVDEPAYFTATVNELKDGRKIIRFNDLALEELYHGKYMSDFRKDEEERFRFVKDEGLRESFKKPSFSWEYSETIGKNKGYKLKINGKEIGAKWCGELRIKAGQDNNLYICFDGY